MWQMPPSAQLGELAPTGSHQGEHFDPLQTRPSAPSFLQRRARQLRDGCERCLRGIQAEAKILVGIGRVSIGGLMVMWIPTGAGLHAAFVLGLAETAVASLIDPGLTLAAAYVLFMVVLLVRPEGLFGRRTA